MYTVHKYVYNMMYIVGSSRMCTLYINFILIVSTLSYTVFPDFFFCCSISTAVSLLQKLEEGKKEKNRHQREKRDNKKAVLGFLGWHHCLL